MQLQSKQNRLKSPKILEDFIKDLGLAVKVRPKSFVMACPICGKKD